MRAPEHGPSSEPAGPLPPPAGLTLEAVGVPESDAVVLSFPLETRSHSQPALTPAERDVLSALLFGYSNAQISAQRGVSPRTTANQVATLFRKLGVHSRLDAARVAATMMSRKMPRVVHSTTHTDSLVAQVSERSDSVRNKV